MTHSFLVAENVGPLPRGWNSCFFRASRTLIFVRSGSGVFIPTSVGFAAAGNDILEKGDWVVVDV